MDCQQFEHREFIPSLPKSLNARRRHYKDVLVKILLPFLAVAASLALPLNVQAEVSPSFLKVGTTYTFYQDGLKVLTGKLLSKTDYPWCTIDTNDKRGPRLRWINMERTQYVKPQK